jgi:hypothetical protein
VDNSYLEAGAVELDLPDGAVLEALDLSELLDELDEVSDFSAGFDFSAGLSDFSVDDAADDSPPPLPLIVLFDESRLSLR